MHFIALHWRKILAVVLLIASFAVGRASTPGPDVVIASSVRFVERKVEVVKLEKAKTKVVYRNVETRPDGTKIDRSIESSATDTKVAKTTDARTDSASESKSTSTAYKPQWRVGALLGVNNAGIRFDRPLGWDLLAAGVIAERRLAGPFWIGAWALSSGPAAGLSFGIEF